MSFDLKSNQTEGTERVPLGRTEVKEDCLQHATQYCNPCNAAQCNLANGV